MIYRYLIYEKDGTLQCWGKTALFNNDAEQLDKYLTRKYGRYIQKVVKRDKEMEIVSQHMENLMD